MDQRIRETATLLQEFLEGVFLREGAEGLVDCLSFVYGQFVVTVDGLVVAASNEFAELLEYRLSELYGISALELVVPEDRDVLQKRFSLNHTDRYKLRLLTKSGVKKYVTVSPHIFFVAGKAHRLAHFVDNSDIVNIHREQIINFRNTASALTHAIEQRDPYTYGHMSRTAYIAERIAKTLQLKTHVIETITLGATLHDIGKISIPIEILTKPGSLASYEWEFIKKHPEIGHSILSDVKFNKAVKDIVLLHHERQDGSGYPFGYQGDEIPLESAIVGIADCLDAIAGIRPYRRSYSFEEAIVMMESEAGKYPKELLKVARHLVFHEELEGREYNPDI